MQLGGTSVVRIATTDHATTTGATRTSREECVGKSQPLRRDFVNIGGVSHHTAIATEIIPTHIVGNDEYDIGSRGLSCEMASNTQ